MRLSDTAYTYKESETEIPKDQVTEERYDAWDTFLKMHVIGGIHLDLKNQNLNIISPKLWANFHTLITLDLSLNPLLKHIPEEVGNLKNLEELRLHRCELSATPRSIINLKKLRVLDMSGNKLTEFFDDGAYFRNDVNLHSLQTLNLSSNLLMDIPQCLKYIPTLRTLNLSQNRIQMLNEICRNSFSNLDTLDLSNNKIHDIPIAFVYFLSSLSSLNITNNDIVKLPSLLGLHRNLREIQIEGNPLKSIRRSIIEKGSATILAYLKDKFVPDQDDIVEEWAMQWQQKDEDYIKKDYSYDKTKYQAVAGEASKEAATQPKAAQSVGRMMSLKEFTRAISKAQNQNAIFDDPDPEIAQ